MGSSSSTLSQDDFDKMLEASSAYGCKCVLSDMKADISTNKADINANLQQIKGLSSDGISETVISVMNKPGSDVQQAITKQVNDTVQQYYVKSSDLQSLISQNDGNIIIGSEAKSVQFGGDAKSPLSLTGISDLTAQGTIQGTSLTDGTASLTAGAATGITNLTASGTIDSYNLNGKSLNLYVDGDKWQTSGNIVSNYGTKSGFSIDGKGNLSNRSINLNVDGDQWQTSGNIVSHYGGRSNFSIDGNGNYTASGDMSISGGDMYIGFTDNDERKNTMKTQGDRYWGRLFVNGSALLWGTLASDSLKGMLGDGTPGGNIFPADKFASGTSNVLGLGSKVASCGGKVTYCDKGQ